MDSKEKNPSPKINLLLVEDDANLSMVLQDFLEITGYNCEVAADGKEGLRLFLKNPFDMCILDIMMPKMDGFTLAAEIRKKNPGIPIIFLTAKSLKEDRLKGFQQGCDDYITKPFSTEELSMRIKAILRRCMRTEIVDFKDAPRFTIGKYTFDVENMQLLDKDKKQSLTRKEAALLKLLCEFKNRLLPRDMALNMLWGDADYFAGRSMDVFIARLRKYLKGDPHVAIINVHGTGFRLEVEESS
jgi:two-component system, OmpR family, response regulator